MTSNEVATTDAELSTEMRYAQALVSTPDRGAQSLLPVAYRGNAANVLIAVGLGKAIGIPPAQALYEIYVVNGRPSPSANLMAALVRRAGHKLRIEGDDTRCTATLVRADDPDYPFSATWTLDQAKAAGLAGKDTWKAYPAAMLRSRAISEVVRMGAPEAVLGMHYSADEARDLPPVGDDSAATPQVTAADFTQAPAPQPTQAPPIDVTDAEVVEDEPVNRAPENRRRAMFAAFGKAAGFDSDARSTEGRQARLDYISKAIGREVSSSNDLTTGETELVISLLEADADQSWTEGEQA